MRVENDLFLVYGASDVIVVWVVEIDLVFVCGPEITWFKCKHLNWLGFCVGGRN